MTGARPAHPATARGLIFDTRGRWLIVRSVGGKFWHLPGGLVEQDESPAAACRREVREEIGLDLPIGALYVVGWNAPRRPGSRARFTFVFRMGVLEPAIASARIRLQEKEIDSWQWVQPTAALTLLHPDAAQRLRVAWGTRGGIYTEGRAVNRV